jgi:hypothetical protein
VGPRESALLFSPVTRCVLRGAPALVWESHRSLLYR